MSARSIQIETAEVFEPLLEPARYKGAWGGRGSGKSHFFAENLIEDALRWPGVAGEGLRALSFREVQKSLKESAKYLLESKLRKFGLTEHDGFKVFTDRIQTPGDGIIAFTGMQDHTADSVKSYEGFHRAWGEEAQSISARSLSLLRPTIRWEDQHRGLISELHFGWNPNHKRAAVDQMLRGELRPTGAAVVMANWRENPWFPGVLEQERLDCFQKDPDNYDHIWEGGYATVNAGAYYAKNLITAKAEGRVGRVAADPLMTIRAIWDIGGTGAKADACAVWIVQYVGREIRFLDYYEAQGQPLSAHVTWLRENGYGSALCVLPHDGATNDRVHDVSYESSLRAAGFEVQVIANQGTGAAMMRVNAARRLFPSMWFNSTKCESGLDAIGWYHEKRDEERGIGLGPNHDWASHGADAFGLVAVAYEMPQGKSKETAFKRRKVV
ncbi:large terminase subunit [Sulfitobacter phage phiGT1]|nr:large terminase subunit [Sulfitobacter phage phiGT1]